MAGKNPTERGSASGRRGFLSSPMTELHREVDRLFEDFMGDFRGFRPRGGFWGGDSGDLVPKVDICETDKAIEVTADLPGIDEKDIDVTFLNGILTIKGERKAETEERDEKKSYHKVERTYGLYTRSIPVPGEVDEDKVKADFAKGVLKITMPKSESAASKVKKISIKSV